MRLLAFALLSVFSAAAVAQNSSVSTILPTTPSSPAAPAGLWLFAGANGAIINSDVLDNLNNGDLFGMRIGGSVYRPEWLYNVGLDLDAMKLEGGSRSNNWALDLAARYRMTDRWSAGPEMVTYIHSGNNISGKGEDLTPFIGAGLTRDIPFTSTLMRVGGRALIDTTIEGQTATMAQLYLELGSNFSEPTRVTEQHEPALDDESFVSEAPAPAAAPAADNSGVVEIMTFNFDVSSAKLARQNQARLAKLGKILKANQGLYQKLEIVGHTDRTGTDKINNPLSRSRAITVAEVMKSVGVNKRGISGRGSHQPVSESDLAANRRVELILTGVKDKAAIENLVKTVQ